MRIPVGIVPTRDEDERDLEKRTVALPVDWWEQLDAIAEETAQVRSHVPIWLVQHSMAIPEKAPQIEGPGVRGAPQSAVYLSRQRWEQLETEARERELSVTRVLQAHIGRGLEKWHADRADKKKRKV